MPIHLPIELRRVGQKEFGEIVYLVMDVVFAVHNELGRFLTEDAYLREIAYRLSGSKSEVPITVSFDDFSRTYFLDLVVSSAAIVEFKVAESLSDKHRAQLVNHLHLANTEHGKLVNLRPEKVEHEFVNATLAREYRAEFEVIDRDWQPFGNRDLRGWLVPALEDWGTGLDLHLYVDACTHFFGGVQAEVQLFVRSRCISSQRVRLAAPGVAFKVTTLKPRGWQAFEDHARRLLAHTELEAIQWINISRGQLLFKTIRK